MTPKRARVGSDRSSSGSSSSSSPPPPRELVFPRAEFEYDYSREAAPQRSDAGGRIRALLDGRHLQGARTGPAATPTAATEATALGEADLPFQHATDEDFLLIPKPSSEAAAASAATPAAATSSMVAAAPRHAWRPPTPRSRVASFPHALTVLHNEVVSLAEHLRPSADEVEARSTIVSRLEALASELFPGSVTTVFGSAATGLCLPGSDVDIVLMNVGKRAIYRLSGALRTRRLVDYMEVIDKARIPIVKFRFKGIPWQADVSFDVESGPRTTDFILRIVEVFPEVRALTVIVKQFLVQRDLNDTFKGGMGSYMTFLTVLGFVQFMRKETLTASRDSREHAEGLGALLIRYFDFYGNALNMEDVGLSLREGGTTFLKRERGWYSSERPFLLSVENPENPELDVGKNSYQIPNIRRAFAHAHHALVAELGFLLDRGAPPRRRGNASSWMWSLMSSVLDV